MYKKTLFIWKLFGVVLGGLILSFSCGRRTAPRPIEEVAVELPLLLSARSFFQGEQLLIQWEIPSALKRSATKKPAIQVNSYLINVYLPSAQCGLCEAEYLGYFRYRVGSRILDWDLNFTLKNPSTVRIRSNQGIYTLILTPDNLPSRLLFFNIGYLTEDERLSAKTKQLHPKQPAEIPVPIITRSLQFKDYLYLSWKKIAEVVRTNFKSTGQQLQTIGYFGVNIYKLQTLDKFKLLNSKPYHGGSIDLPGVTLPILIRHVDRFGNESVGFEIKKAP